MPDLNTLIPQAQLFYSALQSNNSKAWWDENRAPYDTVLKPAATQILAELTPTLEQIADAPITSKLFRPHRDVRFSKDKTPYKTHLHMMWQLQTDARQNPVFFFGVGIDYVTAGIGMMGFDKPVLDDWRKFVDLDTQRIQGIVADVESKGFSLRAPALKRVPSGFAKDHPAGDLLRMKGVIATRDIGHPADLHATLQDAFTQAWPLGALLLQVAES